MLGFPICRLPKVIYRDCFNGGDVTRLRGTSGVGEQTFTARRRERGTRTLALSVAKVFLGVVVFLAPMPRMLAQDPPIDIGMLVHSKDPVYPLKASDNNRYLVDQNNTPFLMVGDSPQQLITNLSQKEAAAFMANRQKYGINALWINLLCISIDPICNRDAKTFDGIVPFLVPGDVATPNPAYFQRVDVCSPSRRITAWLLFWIR